MPCQGPWNVFWRWQSMGKKQSVGQRDGAVPGWVQLGVLRWPTGGLLGTHQGSVDSEHLASYLNEFVFRVNRRRSRSRGMVFYRVLEFAVAHEPVRYKYLVAAHRSRAVPPSPPQTGGHPPSLDRPRANRPWRHSGPGSYCCECQLTIKLDSIRFYSVSPY